MKTNMLSTPENKSCTDQGFVIDSIVTAAAFLFIYTYFIFRFGVVGDEVWDIVRGEPTFYIGAGRWGVTLFRSLTCDIVTPFAYGLFSAVCIGLAVALQIRHFRLRDGALTSTYLPYLYIAISLGIIQLAYMMVASFVADAVCLGYLLSVLGYLTYRRGIQKKQKMSLFASLVCLLFATSMYQTLLLVPALLFVAEVLYSLLSQKKHIQPSSFIKDCFFFLAIILSTLLLYKICITLTMPLASPEAIAACQNYQKSLITWGHAPAWVLMLHTAKLVCIHLVGAGYPGEWFYASTIIPVILLLRHIYKGNQLAFEKILAALCVLSLWVLPFLPIVPIGRDLGARLFFSEPMACALLWSICLKSSPGFVARIPKWLFYTIAGILLTKASYTVSDMAFRQKLIYGRFF